MCVHERTASAQTSVLNHRAVQGRRCAGAGMRWVCGRERGGGGVQASSLMRTAFLRAHAQSAEAARGPGRGAGPGEHYSAHQVSRGTRL